MPEKLVTIITVTFNAASTLEACIESILRHKDEEIEFVVIDGGSKDGTVKILEKYSAAIDVMVSEPDRGIYDAMNKGLDRANGEYILFLGADDLLLHIPKELLASGPDLVVGDVDCGNWAFRHIRPEARLRARMHFRNGIHPQGTFYRKSDIRYSLGYRYCADFLYNTKYLERYSKITYCDEVISKFCTEGASAGWAAKCEAVLISARKHGLANGIKSSAYHLASHIIDAVRRKNS